jgi:hypothetical protein
VTKPRAARPDNFPPIGHERSTVPTDTPAAPDRAALLARHLDLHRDLIQHRLRPWADVDVDEETGRAHVSGYCGWECQGCLWTTDSYKEPYGGCPKRRALNAEIRGITAQLQALDAADTPALHVTTEAA